MDYLGKNEFYGGIDIGSTTVKLVILDQNSNMVYGKYQRHHAHTQEVVRELLLDAQSKLGIFTMKAGITGSGSINLGKALQIPFKQEVVAVATALRFVAPQTDVAIELGGEDAKIIYFRDGLDERMNGVCAGGTGSFIDQMADLLQTDAAGLNEAAEHYQQIYPIAARCGVFAKTDIQPLINEGATKADLAVSIFQAVVNQTISGLACGKPIRGCVAFLGGPLHFLPELKKAFIRTLHLTPENIVDPENSHLFAAMGAALESKENTDCISSEELIQKLGKGVKIQYEMQRLEPLFKDQEEYDSFCKRHGQHRVEAGDLSSYHGNCYLGIDAGSTTTKLVLISEDGKLLYSFYAGNQADPIRTAMEAVRQLKEQMPESTHIARSCSTGYGESLLKSAFSLDEGVVETIAHCTAATFFDPSVDAVLDIGGQDMKCIKLKNGTVDTILLNEACSSGCGSFIENFAASLGFTAEQFAKEALLAKAPVDLGTRCTVFMNSNVKQAQKEGASVSDISAGLAYSVIKNALYKVIKLSSPKDLGSHIVVQGGTFHNQAVLRAFEKIAGVDAVCPDISGLMGAFGAALTAKEHDISHESSMLPLEEICNLTYTSKSTRCKGCTNHCMLTINTFPGGRRHVSGNRCEKGSGNAVAAKRAPNMVEFKRKRIFEAYPALPEAPRGSIGIPRVLNMYENYPFWATFFRELGFHVVLSPFASRKIYQLGMESIPSESECYPAKLAHGQVQWLIDQGIRTIFHPCVFYEHQESSHAQNHFNCPMVISYAENIKNNIEEITQGDVHYIRPFIAFTSEKTAADRLVKTAEEEWQIPAAEVRSAVAKAWAEQMKAKEDIRQEGARLLREMEEQGGSGIVLAGRPYHMDPEINHGIPEMIASYGLTVFTEDSLPVDEGKKLPLRVVDQWVYHSRLYHAADFVAKRKDLELIQLTSFGCGLDAVTSDQVSEILEKNNKLYTLIKIDEVNNLGAVRIRIRSLLAAMEKRKEKDLLIHRLPEEQKRVAFTRQMKQEGYTILAPQMSPIHFDLLAPVLKAHGYHVVILDNDNRSAIDVGLQYVNNDACFPSITVVGQIMQAVLSGKYDVNHLAILMSQTGGCCRASNYIGFIRRALKKAGLPQIPVISLNLNGMERNPGFTLTAGLLSDAVQAVVYGDLMMRCLYRVRPYEVVPGSANAMHEKWKQKCIASLTGKHSFSDYKRYCKEIVSDFDALPIQESMVKPRVGVVGEILVKYMPLANNHLVELLEREGAEAVVPDLMDFMNYGLYNSNYKAEFLGKKKISAAVGNAGIELIRKIRKPAMDALKESKRFGRPMPIGEIAELTKPFLSIGNQYGEGWFLAGEMAELITSGVSNIVCIQPFACLPNHVVGKGVIKALKEAYPQANIAAVDYDASASEVNQLNRIKLLLAAAHEKNSKHSSMESAG